jgi:hypothetical protein
MSPALASVGTQKRSRMMVRNAKEVGEGQAGQEAVIYQAKEVYTEAERRRLSRGVAICVCVCVCV